MNVNSALTFSPGSLGLLWSFQMSRLSSCSHSPLSLCSGCAPCWTSPPAPSCSIQLHTTFYQLSEIYFKCHPFCKTFPASHNQKLLIPTLVPPPPPSLTCTLEISAAQGGVVPPASARSWRSEHPKYRKSENIVNTPAFAGNPP